MAFILTRAGMYLSVGGRWTLPAEADLNIPSHKPRQWKTRRAVNRMQHRHQQISIHDVRVERAKERTQ